MFQAWRYENSEPYYDDSGEASSKTRSQSKSRIHNLLGKYDLKPEYSDLFGKTGQKMAPLPTAHTDRQNNIDVTMRQHLAAVRNIRPPIIREGCITRTITMQILN